MFFSLVKDKGEVINHNVQVGQLSVNPPENFLAFFLNGWEFLDQILHSYYTVQFSSVTIFMSRASLIIQDYDGCAHA